MLEIPFYRFVDLLLAPYFYTDMLWILFPLVASIVLMEFYFGRYKYEELGWSSFFGNAIVLIFVSLDLFRRLYTQDILGFVDVRNLLAIGVGLEGLVLTMVGFFHVLPKNFAFSIGSKLPTSLIAYMAIILVYAPFKIDLWTIIFAIIIVIGLTLGLSSLRSLIPHTVDVEEVDIEEVKKAPKPVK